MGVASTTEMHALLVTTDPSLVTTFTDVLRSFDIDAQKSSKNDEAPAELGRTKYDALVLDFDTISATQPILTSLRRNASNRNALIFAVATGALQRRLALQQGANFLFERPFVPVTIRQVLRRAYDLMLSERRRYFRSQADLPIVIRCPSGAETQGTTLNISNKGLALRSRSAFNLGQEIQIAFYLPSSELRICAKGTVVWDDRHGKTGVNFECHTPEMQNQIDSWLDQKFSELFCANRGDD